MKRDLKPDYKRDEEKEVKKTEKLSPYQVIGYAGIPFAIAYIVLSVLDLLNVGSYESIANFLLGIFWVCSGIAAWKESRKSAVFDFVLAVVWFLLAII